MFPPTAVDHDVTLGVSTVGSHIVADQQGSLCTRSLVIARWAMIQIQHTVPISVYMYNWGMSLLPRSLLWTECIKDEIVQRAFPSVQFRIMCANKHVTEMHKSEMHNLLVLFMTSCPHPATKEIYPLQFQIIINNKSEQVCTVAMAMRCYGYADCSSEVCPTSIQITQCDANIQIRGHQSHDWLSHSY